MRKTLLDVRAEVDEMKDSLREPVDERIRELVVGLLYCGVNTTMSCQGHPDKGYGFPWVAIDPRDISLAASLLAYQNRLILPDGAENKNIWVIRPNRLLLVTPANVNLPLGELQRNTEEFGRFLQNLPEDFFQEEEVGLHAAGHNGS